MENPRANRLISGHSARFVLRRRTMSRRFLPTFAGLVLAPLLPCAQTHFTALPGAPYAASAAVAPEAVKYFTASYEAPGNSLEAEAQAIFRRLAEDLEAAQLEFRHVVNVRGYLRAAPGEDLAPAMAEWNAAFRATFGNQAVPPTRTTLGVTALSGGGRIAVDFVVAGPGEAVLSASRPANPRVHDLPAGWAAVAPFTPLLFTSGTLADPLREGGTDYGPVARQTAQTLEKLDAVLARWGLNARDLVFVRALLSPPLGEAEGTTPAVDFEGFAEAWEDYWTARRTPPPPLSQFASPGFNHTGRLVEIEFYAAFPDALGPFGGKGGEPSGLILREGTEGGLINRSVAVARQAELVWFAGAIDRTRAHPEGQGVNALLNLGERMAGTGVSFESVVSLRAYIVVEEDFRREFAGWNTAYRRFFNLPGLNPEKPVRTSFAVESLPAGTRVEVEVIGVALDRP
jgi:enamine deaminase RidA (YjgF/YER057c/UK114 family)